MNDCCHGKKTLLATHHQDTKQRPRKYENLSIYTTDSENPTVALHMPVAKCRNNNTHLQVPLQHLTQYYPAKETMNVKCYFDNY